MNTAKLRYLAKRVQKSLGSLSLPKIKTSKETVFMVLFTAVISFLILQSIYTSVLDLTSFEVLANEQVELEKIQELNKNLNKQKNYYESPYYIKMYARNSQNLVEENELIFVVDRQVDVDYTLKNRRMESIDMLNHKIWWKNLVFGNESGGD